MDTTVKNLKTCRAGKMCNDTTGFLEKADVKDTPQRSPAVLVYEQTL
jgi:hypothetical protein